MSFTSLSYIIFLVIVFVLYWTVCSKRKEAQNALLLSSSLVFYAIFDWQFLGLLLLAAFSTWYGALLLNNPKHMVKKTIFVLVIIINLGILFYFKYFNFFVQSMADLLGFFGANVSFNTLHIILPVGISFFTFSALSYIIDVYQERVEATKDILAYFAFVTFFPSLLSGPISRATKQLPQYYKKRDFVYQNAVQACKFFLWGAVLKLCLADRIGIYVDAVYGNIAQHNGTTLFLTAILYSIQIYADFSGYSLMAIGSGKLLGIDLQTNFERPYFARTITEFWRRWHISLTTWFRDYIYFPLGGNRMSKARWIMNIMVVFLVSGIWHGAAYNFLIWGGAHGLLQVIEKQYYGDRIKSISSRITLLNVVRIVTTFLWVTFAWIFFRVSSFSDAGLVLKKIFTSAGMPFMDSATMAYSLFFLIVVFLAEFSQEYYSGKPALLNSKNMIVRWCTYIVLFSLVMLFGVLDGSSFIYFQF